MSTALLDNFYTETSSNFSKENPDAFNCTIQLNPAHPIYKGHFEQVPVTPGVCLTQIIKEILADKFQEKLFMHSGDNIKFLMMINPNEIPELTIQFTVKTEEDILNVSATYFNNGVACMKFKGKFRIINSHGELVEP